MHFFHTITYANSGDTAADAGVGAFGLGHQRG